MALLSDEEIEERLKEPRRLAPARRRTSSRASTRGDFVGSVKFVDSLVEPAEEMSHHPDIAISWSKVR